MFCHLIDQALIFDHYTKSKILVNGEVNVLDSQIIKRFDNRGQESNLIDKDFFIFSRVSLGFFLSHDKSRDVTL